MDDRRGAIITLVFLLTILQESDSFLLSNSTQSCLPRSPTACHCKEYKSLKHVEILCDGTSYGVFPDFSLISPSLISYEDWELSITKNDLTYIPGGSFIGFTPANFNVTYLFLDLSVNRISKIENNAFVGLENMFLDMNLTDNNLTEVPAALMMLNQLRGISLQFNPIKVIDPIMVQHLAPIVDYIELGISNFSSWPTGLSSFSVLGSVYLYELQQYKLPLRPLNENILQTIGIYGSDLTNLPCGFTDLNLLDSLTLHNSPNLNATNLVEICRPNYTMSSTVDKIHLVEGELTEFPNILKYTPMLTMLNLYRNQIQYVNENFIPINNRILDLMLSYNNLQTIPASFLRFQHLRKLILDNNNIATVTPALDNLILRQQSYSTLCIRDNPVNTTALTVKCSSTRDSWAL